VFQDQATVPDEQRTGRLEGIVEGGHAGVGSTHLGALHFDGGELASALHNEIHLAVAIAPIEDLIAFVACTAQQVGTYSAFHHTAPERSILPGLGE